MDKDVYSEDNLYLKANEEEIKMDQYHKQDWTQTHDVSTSCEASSRTQTYNVSTSCEASSRTQTHDVSTSSDASSLTQTHDVSTSSDASSWTQTHDVSTSCDASSQTQTHDVSTSSDASSWTQTHDVSTSCDASSQTQTHDASTFRDASSQTQTHDAITSREASSWTQIHDVSTSCDASSQTQTNDVSTSCDVSSRTQTHDVSTSCDASSRKQTPDASTPCDEMLWKERQQTKGTNRTRNENPKPSGMNVAKRTDSINFQCMEDDGYVTGIVVVDKNTLLLADKSNKCLKLVDTQSKEILYIARLPNEPRGIVLTSTNRAAVAIPNEEIIVSVSITRSDRYTCIGLVKDIKMLGACVGLDADPVKERFVVSFGASDTKIEILDFNGKLLNLWNIEKFDHMDTPRPLYVRFLQGGNDVIVSDVNNETISKYHEDVNKGTWTLEFQFSYNYLSRPRDLLVLSDNKLLVAGWKSHNVVLLSENGKFLKTVVPSGGIDLPCALAYSDEILYVSTKTVVMPMEDWSQIKCFHVIL